MAERPLLKLPPAEPYSLRPPGRGATSVSRPTRDRQRARLDPRFERLTNVANDPAQLLNLRSDPSSIAPERAIVFEVEGSLAEFYQQAHAIGLEYLGDLEEDFEPSGDFFDKDHPEKILSGRMYLAMPDVQALRELLSLWNRYKQNQRMPSGKAPWRDLFSRLIDVRPWGPQDRIPEETLEFWRQDLSQAPDRAVRCEIELWFHGAEARRILAHQHIERDIQALNGTIVDHAVIPEIAYDGLLVEVPAIHVQALADNPNITLALADEVMFLRPQSVLRSPLNEDQHLAEANQVSTASEPSNPDPIVGLLDGLPIQNHSRLVGRLIVDDPEDLENTYPVRARVHGTAMASLIAHGNLNDNELPLSRRIYVRPILRPDGNGEERSSADCLLIDTIYEAVKRIKEGDGSEPAAAPSVLAINLSLGDPKRPFARMMSPLGRLLDFLAYRYNVLFLISAGNILERFPVIGFSTWSDFETASPEERERAVLASLNAQKSRRTIYSPAESMNALTIGAAHTGASGRLPATQIEPFTDNALPNIVSAMGLGFKKAIKPELLFPGGRAPVMFAASSPQLMVRPARNGAQNYGLRAAYPSPNGTTNYEHFTWGTSAATALASRALHHIHDSLLDANGGSNHTSIEPEHLPIVLKALLVHGAQWSQKGELLDELFEPQGLGSHHSRRDDISRLLGYGTPDIDRVLDCAQNRATMLGYGTISSGNALLYRIPLPTALDGMRAFRSMVVTLAWFSPVNPRHQGYRMAALDISSASEEKYWITSQRAPYQPTDKAITRGTVYHERRSAEEAKVFVDDGSVLLRVSCRSVAGDLEEDIPYALAVTFEVALNAGIQVYDQIRTRLATPIPTRVPSGR